MKKWVIELFTKDGVGMTFTVFGTSRDAEKRALVAISPGNGVYLKRYRLRELEKWFEERRRE